jgi:single-strand DNA-binding protein
MYLNKTYILGNLTKDPELKSLPNGTKVCNFSLATNRTFKDANGAKQENVEYHNIVMFARQAEVAGQYLKKGQSCLIEGRIQTRSWDDPNGGGKKYRTEIIAESMQMGPKGGAYQGGAQSSQADDSAMNMPVSNKQELDTIDYGEVINPDDIPF